MSYIRVDPPSLRERANDLEQYAEQVRRLADQVVASAEGAPSFEGQFGPKVRALAAQAHAELSRRAADFHERAEQLGAIAARFEQADLESVAGMERLAISMQSWVERSGATLAGWARSPSGQSFFQRLSSLASVVDASKQPWCAPIVLGWQSTWSWFDRALGAPIREGLRASGESMAPTGQTVTPVSTPSPSPTAPTATPVPPSWTPALASTPTVEEMQSASAQRQHEWLDSLQREVMACPESGDPDGCVATVGATIYAHYGWNLFELAASGEDNPLPPDSEEVRVIMASQVSGNMTDPVVSAFLGELSLSPDRYSNFEPAFVEALKTVKGGIYRDVVDEHAWDMAFAREYAKRWASWPAGPLSGQFFVSSE